MKLNDTSGFPREIYLDIDDNKLPVPKIFYKILIDRSTHAGVVLVGVNNPHIKMQEIQSDYMFCDYDVSERIKYIKWRAKDLRRGFSYACSVEDFIEKVPHFKNVRVTSLLV